MSNQLLPRGVTSRRSWRKRSGDKENSSILANGNPSSSCSVNDRSEAAKLLSTFQSAAKATAEANFWKRHSALAECVVEASLELPGSPRSPLILEEHSVELLNSCRRLVKYATESKGEPLAVLHCLCVSVHGIRALATVFLSGTKRNAAIKLLFHAIRSAEAMSSRTSDDVMAMGRAAGYCLAACEALSVYLDGYSVATPPSTPTVFTTRFEKDIVTFFPVPRRATQETAPGCIAIDQIFVIGATCILSMSKVLASPLWITCDWKTDTKLSELRVVASKLPQNLRVSLDGPRHCFLLAATQLIRNEALPWISEMAARSSVKDAVAQCKRAHRLLWDAVDCSAANQESSRMCLSLRGDAVLALLPSGPDGPSGCHSGLESVRLSTFDTACTYAWKAAAHYFQNTSKSAPNRSDDYLRRFHERVGSVLDLCAAEKAPSYFEYCAHRALHIGPFSSLECETENCFFKGLPFPCSHINCDDEKESIDEASLALFLLIMQVRNGLKSDSRSDHEVVRKSERVVARFNAKGQAAKGHGLDRLRVWFRMFSGLSLQKTVVQTCEVSSRNERSVNRSALEAAACILSSALGPLSLRLARSGILEEGKRAAAMELATDYFLRAALAFDELANSFSGQATRYQSLADGSLSTIAKALGSRTTKSRLCLERAAKVSN